MTYGRGYKPCPANSYKSDFFQKSDFFNTIKKIGGTFEPIWAQI